MSRTRRLPEGTIRTLRDLTSHAHPGPWQRSKHYGYNIVSTNGAIIGNDLKRRTLGSLRAFVNRTAALPDHQRIDLADVFTDSNTAIASTNASNGDYIAAADPNTIRALCDEVLNRRHQERTHATHYQVLPDGPMLGWSNRQDADYATALVDAILHDVFQGKRDNLRPQMLAVAAKFSRTRGFRLDREIRSDPENRSDDTTNGASSSA